MIDSSGARKASRAPYRHPLQRGARFLRDRLVAQDLHRRLFRTQKTNSTRRPRASRGGRPLRHPDGGASRRLIKPARPDTQFDRLSDDENHRRMTNDCFGIIGVRREGPVPSSATGGNGSSTARDVLGERPFKSPAPKFSRVFPQRQQHSRLRTTVTIRAGSAPCWEGTGSTAVL